MILTCPACDTKYVVKDGAIPPAGRQVRCASCKHSWHQDPDAEPVEHESEAIDFGGPPTPAADTPIEPAAEVPEQAEAEAMIAEEPQPIIEDAAEPAEPVQPPHEYEPEVETAEYEAVEAEEVLPSAEAADWRRPEPAEEEFVGYSPIGVDEAERGRPWLWLVGMLVLIVAAAAAFWFLAPTEWKAQAGIAGAGATPLQLMITTSDRQPLESGNELVAISGRVINPTDQEQNVPPIRAELRDKQTNAVVHRWTIAPPARVLAPRSSASFNSAEVDVPKGGDELTVTLGG
jgi:predicted Zn finger-like uncharacterized protein